jgi:hypothetical protein
MITIPISNALGYLSLDGRVKLLMQGGRMNNVVRNMHLHERSTF